MDTFAGVERASRWPERHVSRVAANPFIWVAVLPLAYYATAVFAYSRLMMPTTPSAAVLWPPNVFILVAFLVTPLRRWIPIAGLALLLHVAVAATVAIPLERALATTIGSIAQPLLAAAILRLFGHTGALLDTLKGVAAFVVVAVLGAPAVASAVAAAVLTAFGYLDEPWAYWRMRFVTNVLSTIVVTPPLLTFLRWRSIPRPAGPAVAEFLVLLAGLTVSERLAGTLITPVTVSPLLFAPLPFLLWAAVRFGPAGLGFAVGYTTIFRYFANAHPGQVFAPLPDAVVATQLTLIAMSLPLMFLSALLVERRLIEQELRTRQTQYGLATTAGSVGVWDWNLTTNEIYVDPALKKFLGFADHEIANHLDEWGQRVYPDDGPRVMAAAQAHIDGTAPAFELAHRMVHKDGSIRWFLARGVVVEREAGRATRMTGTDTDITAQKQAEQALQEAKVELTRLMRLSDMGGLTATIAHEINQPLCAIVANASAALRWLGRDEPDLTQMRAALEDVVQDGKRASELIRRTRGLFERGEIERRPVSLNEVVHSALALTRGSLDTGGVSVQTQLDPALPLVRADALQLQQVFCNLIVNAVEAMARVEGKGLTISTGSDAGGVFATVIDTGEGFGGDDPERVFRPLVSTRPDGMGIGLSMSRIIVEMHGGRLWATPNVTAGATFHLVLPLSESHA